MTQVRTLYACVGEHETELSFEPNQIITSGKFLDLFSKMFLFLILSTNDLLLTLFFFLVLLTDQHIQFAVTNVVELHPGWSALKL